MTAAEGNIVVVKVGGSTLGAHDTTLADVAELQRRGVRPIVVHGGGPLISNWLKRLDVPTRFERGLRVTDEAALDVVVAVLAGLVNKRLVASLEALGVPAVGLSGADGAMLRCHVADPALGFVGEITAVDVAPLARVLLAGVVPVIAPIGLQTDGDRVLDQLLNINADTAAGGIAAALAARWLVFLTDVEGVRSAQGETLARLPAADARALIESGVIEGGMIPKVEACLVASKMGAHSVIADGRGEHALLSLLDSGPVGTVVG